LSRAGKISLVLKWTALAAIAAFQATVAVLAVQPRVTEAYRLHYIARTSGCYVAPAWRAAFLNRPRPHHIAFAGLNGRQECVYLTDGWRPPDAQGARTKEARARMTVPVAPADSRVILSLRAIGQGQKLRISQGKRALWTGVVAAEKESRIALDIRAGNADRDGMVTLDLANTANDGDLALILYAIRTD
jgi:hypothetical protein